MQRGLQHPEPIVQLDPKIAASIAAGEVIENAAGVVRELLENALDAGASVIDVALRDSQLSSITVADNGHGMSTENAQRSICRHATSKLKNLEDFVSLRTMGFRGEGLSSIAAVSKLMLTTRPTGETDGTSLTVHGGKTIECKPIGCRPGTTVRVNDLFFNTPARRKFLSNTATEIAHVRTIVYRRACAFPSTQFTLSVDGTIQRSFPQVTCYEDRLRAFWQRPVDVVKVEIQASPSLHLTLYLANPVASQSTPSATMAFVNNRPVRLRPAVDAMVDELKDVLPAGNYPLGAIFIDIAGEKVDVNVHPQKSEVRFVDPHEIVESSRAAARAARSQLGNKAAQRTYQLNSVAPTAGLSYDSLHKQHKPSAAQASERFFPPYQPTKPQDELRQQADAVDHAFAQVVGNLRTTVTRDLKQDASTSSLRFLGKVFDRVILCCNSTHLYLVDETSAWKAYLLETLNNELRTNDSLSTLALGQPICRHVSRSADRTTRLCQHQLSRLGFSAEEFGEYRWLFRTIPAALPPRHIGAHVTATKENCAAELIDELIACLSSLKDMPMHHPERIVLPLIADIAAPICCHFGPDRLIAELSTMKLADNPSFGVALTSEAPSRSRPFGVISRHELERRLGFSP